MLFSEHLMHGIRVSLFFYNEQKQTQMDLFKEKAISILSMGCSARA
jgi:hypothetical protein